MFKFASQGMKLSLNAVNLTDKEEEEKLENNIFLGFNSKLFLFKMSFYSTFFICIIFAGFLVLACNASTDADDCPGDMLSCDPPDNSCLPKSDRCDGEVDCLDASSSDEVSCPCPSETFCADGFEPVYGANEGYCYHLKPMDEGTATLLDALVYCNGLMAYLPRPNSLPQLEALGNWLNLSGDPFPGYWLGYKRNTLAPLVNGVLTPENRAIRKNKSLFVDMYSLCPQVEMPSGLWRSPNQPGEKRDERDEMCVAKKKAGREASHEFIGADDFICNGDSQHYVICERCVELMPKQHMNSP